MIEHVLDFRVDAPSRIVTWHRRLPGRSGIRRLRCGTGTLTAIADGPVVRVDVDSPLTLVIDGYPVALAPGHHTLPPPGPGSGRPG